MKMSTLFLEWEISVNTFPAKLDYSRNLKGIIDSFLFLTVIRDANLCYLFQNVQGT